MLNLRGADVACTPVALSFVLELDGTVNDVANYGPLVLLAAAMLWFLARWVRWRTTSFVVTTDRLVHRSGVVAKHGKEIPLERINDAFDLMHQGKSIRSVVVY